MELTGGQVAVVTGGASGIGLALGEAFAARGLRVVLADVQAHPLEAAVESLASAGGDIAGVPTDVRDPEAVEALARATVERFGRVDVVCNNAGVVGPFAPMWEQDLATWRWVLDVALLGVIHGIRAFVPRLVAEGSGHVLNTASVGGLMPLPMLAPYNAAKHAVVGLSETLAVELADTDVGVSVLCPGMVATSLAATSEQNRPPELTSPAQAGEAERAARQRMLAMATPPSEVADACLEAIEAGRLHVITHVDTVPAIRARIDSVLADLPT